MFPRSTHVPSSQTTTVSPSAFAYTTTEFTFALYPYSIDICHPHKYFGKIMQNVCAPERVTLIGNACLSMGAGHIWSEVQLAIQLCYALIFLHSNNASLTFWDSTVLESL